MHQTLLISSFESVWLTGGICILITGKCTKLKFSSNPTFLFRSSQREVNSNYIITHLIDLKRSSPKKGNGQKFYSKQRS